MTPDSDPPPPGITIRVLKPADDEAVLALLAPTLGWEIDDRHRRLFAWKHRASPFGTSPGWIAEDEVGIAGFRTLMRWEFAWAGSVVRAVRAVDTATSHRAQGRGIFRALTMHAVSALANEGVACIFNTPNAKSAPGYFSMGWEEVGHVPISFRPSHLPALAKLPGARVAGDLWSLTGPGGEDASEILSSTKEVEELLASASGAARGGKSGIRTNRTIDFLRWRYGQCPVGYRIWYEGASPAEGMVIFRSRRRGGAVELVIAESIFPPGTRARSVRRTYLHLLRKTGADYAVALGSSRPRGWIPLGSNGPLLTWRPLQWTGDAPTMSSWRLSTGDVELF